MGKFKLRDYDVRVWSDDVFISSVSTLQYSSGRSGEGAQTTADNRELHDQIMDVCRNIRDEFLKLDALIDRSMNE